MMIVSFAWTTQAFIEKKKTETRRFWDDTYMERFWKSCCANYMRFSAYDKSPRFGGKQIGICKLTCKPFKRSLKYFTAEDEKAEGGLWGTPEKYVEMMGGPDKEPYVIRFEIVTLCLVPDNVGLKLFK
jgi:hypothetical protein